MDEPLRIEQSAILKKIASSLDGMTSYQVALSLKKQPAAVARSVQLLERNGFICIEKPKKGVAKPITLTPKGQIYLYGYGSIDIEKFFADNKKEDTYLMGWFKKVIPDAATRQTFNEAVYQEIFSTVEFNKDGTIKSSKLRREVPEIILELITTIIEMKEENQLTVNSKSLREFVKDIRSQFDQYFTDLLKRIG